MPIESELLPEIRRRYEALYTGAIADILDHRGLRHQVLPYSVQATTKVNKVAGVAFTGRGYPAAEPTANDMVLRLEMLESLTPGSVAVWACGEERDCAHWGEIMSAAARQRGCVGAVLDGGIRDLDFVDDLGFPVFARFKCAASSIGRWDIRDWQIPIRIGATMIRPDDFVFGDVDGVVVVPGELTLEVLAEAEDIYRRERAMKDEIRAGVTVKAAFAKYGTL